MREVSILFDTIPVYQRLDLTLAAGRWTVLLGRSGTGKSTLLRAIAGLEIPSHGSVSDADGQPLGGRCAYMAQSAALMPWASVLGNVLSGAVLRGEEPDQPRARDLIGRVGLAGREGELPAALSGGMRQRVALARTLMEDRPVVLMDEPFSALDAITRRDLQTLARQLLAGRTVVMVTHDPAEALALADDIIVIGGSPAHVTTRIEPAGEGCGTAPRRADAPGLAALQARLIDSLALEPGWDG